MHNWVRRHLTWANLAATLALIFAMTGGAFAATGGYATGGHAGVHRGARPAKARYRITALAQISPKVLKQLRGPAGASGEAGAIGPQGAIGPAGPDGKNGENGAAGAEGLPGKSVVSRPFSGTEEPPSEPCKALGGSEFEVNGVQTFACNGKIGKDGKSVVVGSATSGAGGECEQGGATVEVEGEASTKHAVCNGKNGEPWTPNNVLPSKATETGGWAFGGVKTETYPNAIRTAISFPIQLSAPLDEEHVKSLTVGEGGTSECPGTVEKPEAAAGYLCVYTAVWNGMFFFKSPLLQKLSGAEAVGADTVGADLIGIAENETGALGRGTWAVTAP